MYNTNIFRIFSFTLKSFISYAVLNLNWEWLCDNLAFLKKKKKKTLCLFKCERPVLFLSSVSSSFEGLCAQKEEKREPLRNTNKTVLLFLDYSLYAQLEVTWLVTAGGLCIVVQLYLTQMQKRLSVKGTSRPCSHTACSVWHPLPWRGDHSAS